MKKILIGFGVFVVAVILASASTLLDTEGKWHWRKTLTTAPSSGTDDPQAKLNQCMQFKTQAEESFQKFEDNGKQYVTVESTRQDIKNIDDTISFLTLARRCPEVTVKPLMDKAFDAKQKSELILQVVEKLAERK